jgi:DNA/RNA-binding domain of Phe-tRNA-synthetase-like protein
MIQSLVLHSSAVALGIVAPAGCVIDRVQVMSSNAALDDAIADVMSAFESAAHCEGCLAEIEECRAVFRIMGYPDQVPAGERLRVSFLQKGFKRINNVVDAYNVVSAQYAAGLGLHDASKLNGSHSIHVRRAHGDETIRPMFKHKESAIPAGDLIYSTAPHAGQTLAWLGKKDVDGDDFKVTADTTSLALITLGHAGTTRETNIRRCEEVYALIRATSPAARIDFVPTELSQ